MALEVAGWTDEAEELRNAAFERVRGTIDALQRAGLQARGEVLDGDAATAARVAVADHGADEVLVVATRGGRLDSVETLEAVKAAVGSVPAEQIVVDAEAPASPSGS